jgi:hypothetical protein
MTKNIGSPPIINLKRLHLLPTLKGGPQTPHPEPHELILFFNISLSDHIA